MTGKTLGKLPWKSKVPLLRNVMAAIPKIYALSKMCFKEVIPIADRFQAITNFLNPSRFLFFWYSLVSLITFPQGEYLRLWGIVGKNRSARVINYYKASGNTVYLLVNSILKIMVHLWMIYVVYFDHRMGAPHAVQKQYQSFTLRLPRWVGLFSGQTEPVWVQLI